MNELLELLAVLVGIYLFDCVHWARRETVGFRSWWGRRARLVAGEDMPGNERYGIVFAQPLPPFGRLFLTQIHPVSWTRDVACSFVAHAPNPGTRAAQVARVVGHADGDRVETEARRVLVGGATFVEAGSERLARRIAGTLVELREAMVGRRESLIERELARSLDDRAVAARVMAFDDAVPTLRIACIVLFAVVFAGLPALGFTVGLASSWIELLVALVAAQAFVTWAYVHAHRALFPDETRARRGSAILIALSPPVAMRAVDALSRDLLAEFHPLAVARVLLPRDEFEAFTERVLRDAIHPLPIRRDGADPAVAAADAAWRGRTTAAFEAFAVRAGVGPERWRGAPLAIDVECRTHCPRCAQQFTLEVGACARCWDLPLSALRPAPAFDAKAK